MLSKGLSALRATKHIRSCLVSGSQQTRNSHTFEYRTGGTPPSKFILNVAEAVQGVAWWWVLWHLWTEPGHILGEFEYPDPRKWTDEELGIPPIE